jgi:hypothetical protein
MYGAQSQDLANALMADRHRHAAQVGRERSARRAQPSLARVRRDGQSITGMLGGALGALRAAFVGQRPGISGN